MLSRRTMFGGLATLAMPAIIRTPGLLMPIKVLPLFDAKLRAFEGVEFQSFSAEFIAALEGFHRKAAAARITPFVGADGSEYYVATLDAQEPSWRRMLL